jgi:hypothetical protein
MVTSVRPDDVVDQHDAVPGSPQTAKVGCAGTPPVIAHAKNPYVGATGIYDELPIVIACSGSAIGSNNRLAVVRVMKHGQRSKGVHH